MTAAIKKRVKFYTQRTTQGAVTYSYDPFTGANVFKFTAHNLHTDKIFVGIVYGVKLVDGRKLINYWNGLTPRVWQYTIAPNNY
jgi:hypothetical protein